MGDIVSGLLVAFGLYSALPLPQIEWKKNTMRFALGFLPLIGVIVGLCQLGWLWLAQRWQLSGMLYAAVAALLPIVLTGGIHLDGFADTCDALCSYGDREKRLAILKDPHIGAFGVMWLAALFVLQTGLFVQLYETPRAASMLLAGYALARALGGGMIVTQRCAKQSGLARMFADNADKKPVARAMYVWMAVCAAVLLLTGRVFGLAAVACVLIFYIWYIRKCRKNFGGITGDLCGMCITVCETLTLAVAVVGGLCLR